MKILTYEVDRKEHIGILSRDGLWVYPLRAAGMEYKSMLEVVREMSESEIQLLEHTSGLEPYKVMGAAMLGEVIIKAPIPVPEGDIICLGMNYAEHAQESSEYQSEEFEGAPEQAVYFSKRVNHAVATGEVIPSHGDITECLDYEVELAVIIGKDAYRVAEQDVKKYLFGYTVINDVSARDIQTSHQQWYFGKSLDGFAPMGPCILTVDSVPYPPRLRIASWVNEEPRQNSNTRQMIFDIDHIVSELSQGMTLKAGSIISTGTPAGVGIGFDPPRFLAPGDVVECAVEGIGRIKNQVM